MRNILKKNWKSTILYIILLSIPFIIASFIFESYANYLFNFDNMPEIDKNSNASFVFMMQVFFILIAFMAIIILNIFVNFFFHRYKKDFNLLFYLGVSRRKLKGQFFRNFLIMLLVNFVIGSTLGILLFKYSYLFEETSLFESSFIVLSLVFLIVVSIILFFICNRLFDDKKREQVININKVKKSFPLLSLFKVSKISGYFVKKVKFNYSIYRKYIYGVAIFCGILISFTTVVGGMAKSSEQYAEDLFQYVGYSSGDNVIVTEDSYNTYVIRAKYSNQDIFIKGVDLELADYILYDDSVFDLNGNEIVVSEIFANTYHYGIGDKISIDIDGKPFEFIIKQTNLNLYYFDVYVDRDFFENTLMMDKYNYVYYINENDLNFAQTTKTDMVGWYKENATNGDEVISSILLVVTILFSLVPISNGLLNIKMDREHIFQLRNLGISRKEMFKGKFVETTIINGYSIILSILVAIVIYPVIVILLDPALGVELDISIVMKSLSMLLIYVVAILINLLIYYWLLKVEFQYKEVRGELDE